MQELDQQRSKEAQQQKYCEPEEKKKGFFGSIVEGVSDGFDVVGDSYKDCEEETGSKVLGVLGATVTAPGAVLFNTTKGVAKGVGSVFGSIFS
uniref:Uncharacterized protein n=1 Tax=Panagrolaimus superbus TaxID=310955 RepID=A0A914YSZ2_9BILA